MKHKRSSKGIWLDVGVLVICLAIITSCLSSGMFAKFATSSGAGKDKAHIASFNVSAKLTGSGADLGVDADAFTDYELVLDNASEVRVSYSISLEFGSIAEGLRVRLGSVEKTVGSDGSVTFENAGVIAPNKTGITVGFSIIRGEYAGPESLDFTANVKFTQID